MILNVPVGRNRFDSWDKGAPGLAILDREAVTKHVRVFENGVICLRENRIGL